MTMVGWVVTTIGTQRSTLALAIVGGLLWPLLEISQPLGLMPLDEAPRAASEAGFVLGLLGAATALGCLRRARCMLARLPATRRVALEWVGLSVGLLLPQTAALALPTLEGAALPWVGLAISASHVVALGAILLRFSLSPELGGGLMIAIAWVVPAWAGSVDSPVPVFDWIEATRSLRSEIARPISALLPGCALALATLLLAQPSGSDE
jgi:hypothetical protein